MADNLKWRLRAKVVGLIDYSLTYLTLLALFIAAVSLWNGMVLMAERKRHEGDFVQRDIEVKIDPKLDFFGGHSYILQPTSDPSSPSLSSSADKKDEDVDELSILMGQNATLVDSLNIAQRKYILLLFIVFIAFPLGLLQFWAVRKLVIATELGLGVKDALKMATIYRNVNAVLVVLGLISYFVHDHYYGMGIALMLRFIFLYVVSNFVTELNSQVTLIMIIGIAPASSSSTSSTSRPRARSYSSSSTSSSSTSTTNSLPPPSYEEISKENNPSMV